MSKKLTLDYLSLRTKNARLDQLTQLNLWGNDLDDVSILENCPNLEILSLPQNKISSLAPFAKLSKLTELYLRSNAVADISELDNLKHCKHLKVLTLNENPIADKQNYRNMVTSILPQLVKLDGVAVTAMEPSSDSTNKNSALFKKGSSRVKKKESFEEGDDVLNNQHNPFNNNIERNANGADNTVPLSARTPSAKQEKLTLANVGLEHVNNAGGSTQGGKPKTKSRIGGVANFKKFSTASNIRYSSNNKREQSKVVPSGDRSFDNSVNENEAHEIKDKEEENAKMKQSYVRPTLNKSVTLDSNNVRNEDSGNKTQYKKKIIGNCSLMSQKLNEDIVCKTNRMIQSTAIERRRGLDEGEELKEEEVEDKEKGNSNEKVIHEESEEEIVNSEHNGNEDKGKIIVDSVKLLLKVLNEQQLKEIKNDIDILLSK